MATQRKTFGRIPVYKGDYDSSVSYKLKARVTLYGSEFESLIEDNTFLPATLDAETNTVTFDTDHWAVISNGTDAWLAGDKLAFFNETTNPEYLQVTTDSKDKVLEGIKQDGTKVIGGDLNVGGSASINGDIRVLGNMEVSGVSYKVIESPEYLAAWVDAEDKVIFGLKADGKTYVGDADFLNDIKNNQEAIGEIKSYLANFDNLDINALTSITTVENPEFIEAKTDSEGKLLAGRAPDGVAFEKVGFSSPKVSIDGHTIENIQDLEGRSEITTDSEGKIISYRDSDGVEHENVGIETKKILVKESLDFGKDALEGLNALVHEAEKSNVKKWNLPKFGYCDIFSETFYLTKDERYSDINGVYLIQDYLDTNENAQNKITLSYYYIKSTLTDNGDGTYSKNANSVKLDFYAAANVTKIGDAYYVTSTLNEGEVVPTSIEVTQLIGVPDVTAWSIDKKTEHYCRVSVNFEDYLNGTFYMGVKFQGSSTLLNRKKNFRFTFYKNTPKPYYPIGDDKFGKKDKIKIGEFVRLSGFNLKANWGDIIRTKECILNRIFMDVWEKRDVYDQYPWNKDHTPYTAATGMIKGFPIEVKVGGKFYGLDIFGLKKDGKNYILDKDADGMIECGTRGNYTDRTNWLEAAPIDWEDELNDEEDWVIDNQTQSNYDALTTFFDFINGRLVVDGNTIPFNKSTMPERMSIIDWIDYAILFQVFVMSDNSCRNMILYTGSDKKKFYPFFYDLDMGWQPTGHPYDLDCFIPAAPDGSGGGNNAGDMSLWDNFKSAWWDEICNRYHELRKSVLSIEYITAVCKDVIDNIPAEEFDKENLRWGRTDINKNYISVMLNYEQLRLEWLDKNYFI